jgi:glucosamine--fructose-6-phosphate aminotransferase (isomerizing)
MPEPIEPDVLTRQAAALAADLRELAAAVDDQVRALPWSGELANVGRVVLTGDGDSWHASCATEMAFETIADIACEPAAALRFLEYGVDRVRRDAPGRTLVVATSASGATERVVQAIERARRHGAFTVALTGRAGSPVTEAADRSVVVALRSSERSPGIRTYQASLLGMLLIALRLGESRGALAPQDADRLRAELVALADAVAATADSVAGDCAEAADAIADGPALVMTGCGPNHGTALFAAAKVVEAAGVLAMGQDVEEWCHVERFAYPLDMPVFVIAPPGRSHWRAVEMAERATALGRRVVAVAGPDDAELAGHAWRTLPVRGAVREEFSPLLYHVFAAHLACGLARRLGRRLFQG